MQNSDGRQIIFTEHQWLYEMIVCVPVSRENVLNFLLNEMTIFSFTAFMTNLTNDAGMQFLPA